MIETPNVQGDQIELFFTVCAIVYFGQFKLDNFWGNFFTEKDTYVLNLTQIRIVGDFSYETSGNPDTKSQYQRSQVY
jgi:hypothetical protein